VEERFESDRLAGLYAPHQGKKAEVVKRSGGGASIRPKQSGEFVAAMEDILKLHEEPYDPARPVICMDETKAAADRLRIRATRNGRRVPLH